MNSVIWKWWGCMGLPGWSLKSLWIWMNPIGLSCKSPSTYMSHPDFWMNESIWSDDFSLRNLLMNTLISWWSWTNIFSASWLASQSKPIWGCGPWLLARPINSSPIYTGLSSMIRVNNELLKLMKGLYWFFWLSSCRIVQVSLSRAIGRGHLSLTLGSISFYSELLLCEFTVFYDWLI